MGTTEFYTALQAWTSLATAICTFLSLVAIAIYTVITRNTFREAHLANQEGLRPVLILFEIVKENGRILALYKHTGKGMALDLTQAGSHDGPDSNVLAPDQELLLDVTDTADEKVIELHYAGLDGRRFITLSAIRRDGRVLNHYIPDAAGIDNGRIKAMKNGLENRAVLGDVISTTKRISENAES